MMESIYERKRTLDKIEFTYAVGTNVEDREIHPYHEVLYYMDGDAAFLTEKFRKTLLPGTLLRIPAEKYHCFKLKTPESFVRLKIKIPQSILETKPVRMNEIEISEKTEGLHKLILDRIIKEMHEEKTEEGDFLLEAALGFLLAEIDEGSAKKKIVPENAHEKVVQEMLRFIEENLAGDVSIYAISRSLHISSSAVSHLFRQHMGVSLHKYVTEKRLSLARKRIEAHEKPSKVFVQCGYKDYSAFYKAYIKMYGHPPSDI